MDFVARIYRLVTCLNSLPNHCKNFFPVILIVTMVEHSLIEIIPGLAPVYWYVATLVRVSPIENSVCANFLSDQSAGFFRES